MDASPPSEISVLLCGRCGAEVALAAGDFTVCASCGEHVVMPPVYLALRDAAWEDMRARADANVVYRALSQPPPLWRSIVGGDFAFLFVLVAFPASAAWFAVRMRQWAESQLGWHFWRSVDSFGIVTDPVGERTAFYVVCAFAWIVLPLFVVTWARRLGQNTDALRSLVRATPPSLKGGPARCRACGALLSVPSGELGARCMYCRADNLVTLPDSAVASMERQAVDMDLVSSLADAQAHCERYADWQVFYVLVSLAVSGCIVFGIIYLCMH